MENINYTQNGSEDHSINKVKSISSSFNWVTWRKEVLMSKPKSMLDIEVLREKYAQFDLESQDAIKRCNAYAKAKCRTIISSQKVHMLASLPHEKHANTFNWTHWSESGLKALMKRSEKAHEIIIQEVSNIGECLPLEDQLFFSECIEYFLLKEIQTLYNGFNTDFINALKTTKHVLVAADMINQWAKREHEQITQFFY